MNSVNLEDITTGTLPTTGQLVRNEVRPATLAIVGEAPGEREERDGKPFVGWSGSMLFGEFNKFGVSRFDTAILNVSQHCPPGNDFNAFEWDSFQVQDGISALAADLQTIKPNLVLCLGNAALHVMKHGNVAPEKHNGRFFWPSVVSTWRGSLFRSTYGPKAMSTFHPAYIARAYKDIAYLRSDLARAASERKLKELVLPQRFLLTSPLLDVIIQKLEWIVNKKAPVALDIEGGIGTMSCISFALDKDFAFIVPFTKPDGSSYWCEEDERILWYHLVAVLSDPTVPKVLQNCLYDYFVLAYGYKTPIRGIVDDTMLKFWELLPELEKGLGVQASLLTKEPYYKDARSTTGETLWTYCCKDSAVTFECNEALDRQLKPEARKHYDFNMALLPPTLYMQVRGLRFDAAKRDEMSKEIREQSWELQHRVNKVLGTTLADKSPLEVLARAHDKCCYKRSSALSPEDLCLQPKANFVSSINRIAHLCKYFTTLTPAALGELEYYLDTGINVDSSKQMQDVLYRKLALPVQYKKERGIRTDKVSADKLALLTLYGQLKNKNNPQADVVFNMLVLRGLYDRIQNQQTPIDSDGRVRASYNIVGSETGRFACYGSNTGSGGNLQTITKRDRVLYRADENYYFFQCDLSGADGWTVAAHCASLGDQTMLEDYLAGLKPAKILALMYKHGSEVARWSRDKLREESKEVDKDSWQYFTCKCIQHMSNYGGKPPTIQDKVLIDSYKISGVPIYVTLEVCKNLQAMYLSRYCAVLRWHARSGSLLKATGQLRGASGHTRTFFGRREDYGTLKEYLADEPQENTTYACNRALLNIYSDLENRDAKGRLYIEPLHQMHDAVIGQFPADRIDWAVVKIRKAFDNHLTIAGIDIVIPFEGGYGRSWGELDNVI